MVMSIHLLPFSAPPAIIYQSEADFSFHLMFPLDGADDALAGVIDQGAPVRSTSLTLIEPFVEPLFDSIELAGLASELILPWSRLHLLRVQR